MADELKKLPHRNWDELRDAWIDALPNIDFDKKYPEPTIWDLPDAKDILENPSEEMPYVSGIRESVFTEAILLTRKFTYCRKVAWQSNMQGFPTWAIIAAYDACFYAAKAICCFLGIVSLGRHSKWYMNVLASNKIKVSKREWQFYPVLKAYQLSEFLTHKMLWRITSRLLRTLSIDESNTTIVGVIKSIDFVSVSETRNGILYHGGRWAFSDNVDECDLHKQLSKIMMVRALKEGLNIDPRTDRYFHLVNSFEKIICFILDDISKLAPAYLAERRAVSDWQISISYV